MNRLAAAVSLVSCFVLSCGTSGDGGEDGGTGGDGGMGYYGPNTAQWPCEPDEEYVLTNQDGDDKTEFCSMACEDVATCPAPPSGDAPAVCESGSCYLSCLDGETCPDGMECLYDFCWWRKAAGA